MAASARASTTLEATFGARENHMLTPSLRRMRASHKRKTLEKKAFQRHLTRKNACECARICYFSRRFSLRGNSGTAFHAQKFFEE